VFASDHQFRRPTLHFVNELFVFTWGSLTNSNISMIGEFRQSDTIDAKFVSDVFTSVM
jgi:hypothetical protein